MVKANVYEVKAKLSEYLDRAARGERIVICRHNTPVAELRAVEAVRMEPRPVGPLRGRPTFDLPPAFFDPMTDADLRQWEGITPTDPLSAAWPNPPARAGTKVPGAKGKNGTPRRRRSARHRS